MAQWLRLHAPNAGGLGSIPGWGTRPHMQQLRVHMWQIKILDTTIKTRLTHTHKRANQHRIFFWAFSPISLHNLRLKVSTATLPPVKKKSSWLIACLVTLKIGCGNQDIFQRPQKSRNGNPFSSSYPGLSNRVGNMETWAPRHGVV